MQGRGELIDQEGDSKRQRRGETDVTRSEPDESAQGNVLRPATMSAWEGRSHHRPCGAGRTACLRVPVVDTEHRRLSWLGSANACTAAPSTRSMLRVLIATLLDRRQNMLACSSGAATPVVPAPIRDNSEGRL